MLAEIALREREDCGQRLRDATTLVHEEAEVEVEAEVGKAKEEAKGGWRERGRQVWEGWKRGMRESGMRGCGIMF